MNGFTYHPLLLVFVLQAFFASSAYADSCLYSGYGAKECNMSMGVKAAIGASILIGVVIVFGLVAYFVKRRQGMRARNAAAVHAALAPPAPAPEVSIAYPGIVYSGQSRVVYSSESNTPSQATLIMTGPPHAPQSMRELKETV